MQQQQPNDVFVERRRLSRVFASPELDCELSSDTLAELLAGIGPARPDSLPDRTATLVRLEREVDICLRWQRPLGFMIARVEGLARMEEETDAETAEKAVEDIGERFWHSVRATDVVGRWSLHELAFVLPDAFSEGVAAVAKRLRWGLQREPLRLGGTGLLLSEGDVSFGGASWRASMTSTSDLCDRARNSLHEGTFPGSANSLAAQL